VTVSRLRRALAPAGAPVETLASGYRLAVADDAIDAGRFEQLLERARAARAAEPEAARRLLDDAPALWRGPALADAAFEGFAQGEIARLEELRLVALEERLDARLASGEAALVVGELEQLAAEHPLRERLVGLLMLALYRSGRQADALEAYTRARRRLDEELGLDPSAELQQLQAAILRQDASLTAPGAGERPPEGVVTMLFTDIESSTRMARAAGAAWPEALAIHHHVVAGAVERGRSCPRQRGRRAVRVFRRPERGSRGGGGRPGGIARARMARRRRRAARPDGNPHRPGLPFGDGLRRARGASDRADRRSARTRPVA
jgi:DNA-binding SARP family transcriptional activator